MKKALHVIKNILVWIVIIFAAVVMIFTIISMTTLDKNDRNIFGFKFFVVQTDSMSATDFSAGDIVISRNVDPSTLKEGDIITFISQNSVSRGQTVTHKIRRLTTAENGQPGFITYGTTTDSDDETAVTYENILGKYQFSIPKVGGFFASIRSKPSNFMFILIPVGAFLLFQVFNVTRLYKKGKKEESDAEEEERKKVEEEKRESEEVRRKLKELQAQIEAQQAALDRAAAERQQTEAAAPGSAPDESAKPEDVEKPAEPVNTDEQATSENSESRE